MRKRFYRLISMIMTIVLVTMAGVPVMADSIPLTTPGGEGPNGTFDIYVYDGAWTLVDKVGANMYIKPFELQIPKIESDGDLRIKIVKSGGGLAHLDQVLLNNSQPIQMNPDEGNLLYKLYNAEYDVLEVDENGLEVVFANPKATSTLRVAGRIEAEVISETPHAYPLENQYKPIEMASGFYTYEWNSHVDSPTLGDYGDRMGSEPFFKEFSTTGSGHPFGYTYGWASNDSNNLYVLMDFTSDNTMDGDKDYAAVHINTPEGMKTYKVSLNETTYGETYFTYTDKVDYQHKVYEFVIPVSEIPVQELGALELTFTAYGTSTPGSKYAPSVAYSTYSGLYLLAYEYTNEDYTTSIIGQFLDINGDVYGEAFEIVSDSGFGAEIIYNNVSGEFLIVWSHFESQNYGVYASILNEDGSIKQGDFLITSSSEDQFSNTGVTFDPTSSKYFIFWERVNSGIEAAIMDANMSTIPVETGITGVSSVFNAVNNSTDNTFDLIYRKSTTAEVWLLKCSPDGTIVQNSLLMEGDWEQGIWYGGVDISHNATAEDNYIVWYQGYDAEQKVYGTYTSTSESAILFSVGTNTQSQTLHLTTDPNNGQIFVGWEEMINSEYVELGAFVDSYGERIERYGVSSSSAITVGSALDVFSPTSKYNADNDTLLVTYGAWYSYQEPSTIETVLLGTSTPGTIDVDASSTVLEGSDATVTLTRSVGTDGTVMVDYKTISGTAIETDYTPTSGTAVFLPGETEKTITITTASDSLESEGDEQFTFVIENPIGGASLGTTTTHTVTITDNVPDYGTIEFSTLSQTVNEGDTVSIIVTRTGSAGIVTVDYATVSGTAISTDFVEESGVLTFAEGDTSETITIQTTPDEIEELTAEYFTVELSNPQGGASLNSSADVHTVTISAESTTPNYGTIEFASASQTVTEGDAVTITVSRTGGSDGEVRVDYATAIGSADSSDFTAASGTLIFADGDATETITVQTTSDSVEELTAETFTVVLSNPQGGASLNSSKATHTVTLSAESAAPNYGTFEFYTLSQTVTEGNSASIKVKRTGGTDGEVTISYSTVAGTATTDDFTPATGILTFADGDSEEYITIQTTADSVDESTAEIFTVVLSNPQGGASLNDAKDTHTVSIEDPEQAGEISFSKQAYSVTEGQTLQITLTRTGGTDGNVDLMYEVTAGTASLSDIDMEYDHDVVFLYDGEDSVMFSIPTVDDTKIEGTETFTITLSEIYGAELGTYTTATVSIVDNDKKSDKDDNDDRTTDDNTDTDTTTGTITDRISDATADEPEYSDEEKEELDKQEQEKINESVKKLNEYLEQTPENLDKEEVADVFDSIEDSVEFITDEEELTTALINYIGTINTLSSMTQQASNVVWVNNKVVEMNTTVAKSIQKIEDDAAIVELTKNFVKSIEDVQANSKIVKTVAMKGAVEKLAQGALNKLGVLETGSTTEKVGEVTNVQFEKTGLQELVQQKVESFNAVKQTFDDFYGEQNVREFEMQVTLATERVDDKVAVQLDAEVLDTLDTAGVDAIGVQVGGTKLMLDKDVYTSEEIATKPKVIVDMGFEDKVYTQKDEKVNFKKGYVTDVNVILDDAKQETLKKPVRLSFELDDFEFWDTEAPVNQLSVFRLNEETDEWEPVGGVYDPVTNSISTRRITLSQYTVMQSNKAFADVENSWAKDEINELLNKGILDETASFNPKEAITREEFTTWVARAYGVTNDNATAPFMDIDPEHEHYTEIASAYNAGLVSGSGGDVFNPEATITKEQMSAILANAMVEYDQKQLNEGLTGALASAVDADLVSDWASDDMAMLMELGVISKEAGSLNPQQEMTKEEAAAILKKIYG